MGEETKNIIEDEYVNTTIEYVSSLEEKIKKQHDDYLYLVADFDNYRKHMSDKFTNTVNNANKNLIKQLLDVLDDFERSFDYEETSQTLIYNKLFNLLKSYGLQKIKTEYLDIFNVDTCNAVGTVDINDPDKDNKIQEVVLPGYKLNDEILRYSQVIVYKFNDDTDEKTIGTD